MIGWYHAAALFEMPYCCYCQGTWAMPISLLLALLFVIIPPPPAVTSRSWWWEGSQSRSPSCPSPSLGRQGIRANDTFGRQGSRADDAFVVFAAFDVSGVGGGGGAGIATGTATVTNAAGEASHDATN